MNSTYNLHMPLPGENAMFYCVYCKKSFSAKVPHPGILSFLKKAETSNKVKCPDCKKYCGFDPRIKY